MENLVKAVRFYLKDFFRPGRCVACTGKTALRAGIPGLGDAAENTTPAAFTLLKQRLARPLNDSRADENHPALVGKEFLRSGILGLVWRQIGSRWPKGTQRFGPP